MISKQDDRAEKKPSEKYGQPSVSVEAKRRAGPGIGAPVRRSPSLAVGRRSSASIVNFWSRRAPITPSMSHASKPRSCPQSSPSTIVATSWTRRSSCRADAIKRAVAASPLPESPHMTDDSRHVRQARLSRRRFLVRAKSPAKLLRRRPPFAQPPTQGGLAPLFASLAGQVGPAREVTAVGSCALDPAFGGRSLWCAACNHAGLVEGFADRVVGMRQDHVLPAGAYQRGDQRWHSPGALLQPTTLKEPECTPVDR